MWRLQEAQDHEGEGGGAAEEGAEAGWPAPENGDGEEGL